MRGGGRRTEALHRGGRVEAAGEDHLHRVALAHLADEALRAAEAGEHADLNLGLREDRRLARVEYVERHRKLHATARLSRTMRCMHLRTYEYHYEYNLHTEFSIAGSLECAVVKVCKTFI